MDRETISKIVKTLIIVAILIGLGWWGWRGMSSLFEGPPHPHPTDPAQAAENFFVALEQPDLQKCYSALSQERKSATGVGLNSRDDYYDHFQRIRRYLIKRASPHFTQNMHIDPSGRTVTFDNDVTLTLKFDTTIGNDKQTHYGIDEINEFPIDKAPSLGIEARNRAMDKFIESLETGRPENPSTSSREQALINAFEDYRQLDTRHDILEMLVNEYGSSPTTIDYLRKLVRDKKQPRQFRRLAADHLGISLEAFDN
jgi:hypothetical protein